MGATKSNAQLDESLNIVRFLATKGDSAVLENVLEGHSCSPVIVLGMHKSGTTLVSEILHQSGINMTERDTLAQYDDGNKMEREQTRCLNIDLLQCDHVVSYKVIRSLDLSKVSKCQWDMGRRIVSDLSAREWGFKDPRTLLTLQFWSQLISDPLLVGVFRHPAEVFLHFKRRNWKWYIRDPLYLIQVLRAWAIYNTMLVKIAHDNPKMLILDYNFMMKSSEGLKCLETYLGRSVMDIRKPNMYRGQAQETVDYQLSKRTIRLFFQYDVDNIYSELKALAHDETRSHLSFLTGRPGA